MKKRKPAGRKRWEGRKRPRGGRARRGWLVVGFLGFSLELRSRPGGDLLCSVPLTPETRARLARQEDGEEEPVAWCLGRPGYVDERGCYRIAGSDRVVHPYVEAAEQS